MKTIEPNFIISSFDGLSRRGNLNTAHGVINTPAFMPVGTLATVKALSNDQILSTSTDIILSNAYHLMIRPGVEIIEQLGGLHGFMNWNKPILTDSGGFQVMSLSDLATIDDDGVNFKSHIDGKSLYLSPEKSMNVQMKLGVDIAMVLDECTAWGVNFEEAKNSMKRSMLWAERCKKAWVSRKNYLLFGIVQGSFFDSLRLDSIKSLTDIGFDGYGIGGLAVGEGQEEMFRILSKTVENLPKNLPRYLMGVGKPDDIVGGVLRGVDMFDCVLPTRSGRTGQAFTRFGAINIRNSKYSSDSSPLDNSLNCPASINYSKAYLHHLFKSKEILGATLLSWHNIAFYQWLMKNLREAITKNSLDSFAKDFLDTYKNGNR
ncbi:tRNA guanosine(34) transglycosylase Tgt [Alphaproteobacteria bacterium]|nr:tRNA guanosine(34) transglycosylase Tgt [Alphaproteobacteria bacterium]